MSDQKLVQFAKDARRDGDRFWSLLSQIPGIDPLPAIGDWILFKSSAPERVR